jgi:glycosyltransferase involved in cell wall biosynthesis
VRIGVNALFLLLGRYGGLETYLRALLRELPLLAPDDEFIVFTERTNARSFGAASLPNLREVVCSVPALPNRKARWGTRIVYEYGFLPRRARKDQIDVLFSPCFTAPAHPAYTSVVTIPDVQQEDHPEYFSAIDRRIFVPLIGRSARTAAHILTLSTYAKHRIVALYGVPEERVIVTPLAADARFSAPVSEADIARVQRVHSLRPPYILSVATLHPHKNIDALIDAFSALRAQMAPAPQLVLVGLRGMAAEQLQAHIRRAGLSEVIRLTGFVPDADLPAIYRGAAVFALPSRYEGFGIPVLEAMASGVPVITTTATSLPEVAGDAAILVDPDDRAALVAALWGALTDEALRGDLIARGHIQTRRFAWRQTAETTLATLRQAAQLHDTIR